MCYDEEPAPTKFSLKEHFVLARGMLPEIGVDESEEQIRKKIAETLRDSDDSLACILTDDFEFLEACGKNLCVPVRATGVDWTGRALKELAGSGSVYIRLLVDVQEATRKEMAGSPSRNASDGSTSKQDHASDYDRPGVCLCVYVCLSEVVKWIICKKKGIGIKCTLFAYYLVCVQSSLDCR